MGKKILGIDNGYNFTKTSMGTSFLSTVKEGHDDYNTVLEMEFDGKNYILGESNGEFIADADKLKSESGKTLLKLTTLAAIGLSYPEEKFIEVNIVAGLPVAYYSKQKDDFKKFMKELDGSVITLNKLGFKQTIKIDEVLIFPQSAGIIIEKSIREESSLVIDVGGGTWDVSQFSGLKLVKKATYGEGMLILYSNLAQYLNSNYYTKYNATDMYDLLKRGYFTAEGQKQSTSILDPMIKEHVTNVMTQIKRDFETTNVDNIFGIGGGIEEVEEYILKDLPAMKTQKDSQFNNVKNFALIGKIKLD